MTLFCTVSGNGVVAVLWEEVKELINKADRRRGERKAVHAKKMQRRKDYRIKTFYSCKRAREKKRRR